MPGVLTGAVEGFDAGQLSQARAAQLGLETDRFAYEKNRQTHVDALPILAQQAESIRGRAMSPDGLANTAYLKAQPTAPDATSDPEGNKKWNDANDYFKGLNDEAETVLTARDAHVKALTGLDMQATRAKAAQNTAAVLSGAKSIHDLPAGDVTDMLSVKSQLPPDAWRTDPNTGKRPVSQTLDDAHDALTTGNWAGKGHVLTTLYPQTQAVIGKTIPGIGTISGVTIGDADVDPQDPNKITLRETLQVHDKDGNVKYVSAPPGTPGTVVSRDDGAKRLVMLQGLEKIADHPDISGKIDRSFDERSTYAHKLNDTLLAAGVSPNELLPAPYGHVTLKPGESMYKTSAITGEIVGGPEATSSAKRTGTLGLAQSMVDEGSATSISDALDQINESRRLSKNPPADGGAAASALTDQRRQKSGDVAHRGAVSQIASEHGYYIDKDGSARYGSTTAGDDGHKKGDVVNDPDFDQAVSIARQAQDEAVEKGKPLPTSKLAQIAKDKLKELSTTPKPLPESKNPKDFVVGHIYQVPGHPGDWKWDGKNLVKVKK